MWKLLGLLHLVLLAAANLLEPTFEEFDDLASSTPRLFVTFCQHGVPLCATARPAVARAADAMKDNPHVKVAYIIVEEGSQFISQYGLAKYPRFLMFNGNQLFPETFVGWRGADQLIEKLQEVAYPNVEEYTNPASAHFIRERLLKRKLSVLDAVFTKDTYDLLHNLWLIASNFRFKGKLGAMAQVPYTRKNIFSAPDASENMSNPMVMHESTIDISKWVFRLHVPDTGVFEWPKDRIPTLQNMTHWFDEMAQPLVAEVEDDSLKQLTRSNTPAIALIVDDDKDDEDCIKSRSIIKQFAKEYMGRVRFVVVNGVIYQRWAEAWNLGGVFPAIVGLQGFPDEKRRPMRYRLGGEGHPPKADKLRTFIDSILAKTAKPHLMSTKEPYGKKDANGIWILTGKTVERGTIHAREDVFLYLYEPTCPMCLNATSIFQQVAKVLHKTPGLRFAKIDSSKNEIALEGINTAEVPTFVLFKFNDGLPLVEPYRGKALFVPILEFFTTQLGSRLVMDDAFGLDRFATKPENEVDEDEEVSLDEL